MKGFFTMKETQSENAVKGKILSCVSCGLAVKANNPRILVMGKGKKNILIVTSSTNPADDEAGQITMTGDVRKIDKHLRKFNIDIKEDCHTISAYRCHSDNVDIHNIDCCRKNMVKLIKQVNPNLILTVGEFALRAVLGNTYDGLFKKWVGWCIPSQTHESWIGILDDVNKDGVSEVHFKQHLKSYMEHIDRPLLGYPKPNIQIIKDLNILKTIDSDLISIDYETTGLKPHDTENHKIVCVSIAYSENDCYVFMMPKNINDAKPFIEILENSIIRKMAHNMKFEECWSVNILKTPVQGWFFDTMIASHILDQREKICGLKFQAYVRMGVEQYNDEVDMYLRGEDEKNANSTNRILELIKLPGGKEKLMKYCGLDTIYQYRLAKLQMKDIGI